MIKCSLFIRRNYKRVLGLENSSTYSCASLKRMMQLLWPKYILSFENNNFTGVCKFLLPVYYSKQTISQIFFYFLLTNREEK
jgi:hypothetical protein